MNDKTKFILESAKRDLIELGAIPAPVQPEREGLTASEFVHAWPAYCRAKEDWEQLRNMTADGVVRLDLSRWLGRVPSHSETTLYSRAYADGERLGLWERIKTDAGRTWAIQLKDPTP